MAEAAAQREAGHAPRLRRELQAARGGQAEAARGRDLAHGGADPARAKRLLQHHQHALGRPGLGIDHPVRIEADGGERGGMGGREQARIGECPDDRTPRAGECAGGEQGGEGGVFGIRPAARDLMQRAAREAASGQMGVDRGAQGQRAGRMRPVRCAFEARDLLAEVGERHGKNILRTNTPTRGLQSSSRRFAARMHRLYGRS